MIVVRGKDPGQNEHADGRGLCDEESGSSVRLTARNRSWIRLEVPVRSSSRPSIYEYSHTSPLCDCWHQILRATPLQIDFQALPFTYDLIRRSSEPSLACVLERVDTAALVLVASRLVFTALPLVHKHVIC